MGVLSVKVADFLLAQLASWGVERVYGVVGDAIFDLVDALARQNRIRFIACRHEAAAGFMASAEAKLTGRPGVCIATSGPGVSNLINGLGDAYADRVPVLAITGQSPTGKLGTGFKQDIDQQRLLGGLAGYTALLAAPGALPHQLALAWRAAVTEGRVGHLSIPKDLFTQELPATVRGPEPYLGALPVPADVVIAGALPLLNGARRPVILAGHGALPAAGELVSLAEAWGAPVITALPAKGLIPYDHPLALGGLGHGASEAATEALNEADLVLAVATNWWPEDYVPGGTGKAHGASAQAHPKIVRIDSHPAMIGGKAPVDYGLAGDVRHIVPRVQAGLQGRVDADWVAQVQERKRRWTASLRQEFTGAPPTWVHAGGGVGVHAHEVAQEPGTAPLQAPSGEAPAPVGLAEGPDAHVGPGLHPSAVIHALEQVLPPDAVVSLDTGDHTVWFNRAFGGAAHRVLVSGTWRSIGFGLPGALAAKLAQPERTVAAVVGDGGLTSLPGELLTAARYQIPVLILVMNNGMYAMEYNGMVRQGLAPLETTLNNPDFALLAEACGVAGVSVSRVDQLEEALQRALAMGRPVLLDVAVAPVPVPGPKA